MTSMLLIACLSGALAAAEPSPSIVRWGDGFALSACSAALAPGPHGEPVCPGQVVYCDANMRVGLIADYNALNVLHGVRSVYLPNGTLYSMEVFSNGVQVGESLYYDEVMGTYEITAVPSSSRRRGFIVLRPSTSGAMVR